MASQKETALDIEYNMILAQLKKTKDTSIQLNADLTNLSKKITSCSKRGEISEEYKKAAEKTIAKLTGKIDSITRMI